MTFRIGVALGSLQYLDNNEPQRFDFCIDCKSTDRTCQLHYHQEKIMIIYEGANILVSGAFLKCFSICWYAIDFAKPTRIVCDSIPLLIHLSTPIVWWRFW